MYFMMYGISPFEFSLKEGGSLKLAVVSGVVKFPNDVPGYFFMQPTFRCTKLVLIIIY